jgi:YbbR domain-containing protein
MQNRIDLPNPLMFIWNNRDTLLLAFLLALAVWVSAVYADDPNREDVVSPNVALEVVGLADDEVLLTAPPTTVRVTLRAPESVWQAISENPDLIRATVDFANLGVGTHTVPIQIELLAAPAQLLSVQPAEITVNVDEYVVRDDIPLVLKEVGTPAPGFQRDNAGFTISRVEVSGPASRVALVTQVLGTVSLEQSRQNFNTTVELQPVNDDQDLISGVEINPIVAEVFVEISQAGQYRDVAVVVETLGEPASGYERTSIDVDPLIVTLYAENEEDIADIPGFVSTKPIVLTNKTASFVIQIGLELPPGVIQAGDQQTVAVSIGISPKLKNLSLSVPISITGLASGYAARLSPETVEVLLVGPEPVMNTLTAEDVFVFVSLDGLGAGTAFVELEWDVLPDDVEVVSINPDTIEVVITESNATPTPTPTRSP